MTNEVKGIHKPDGPFVSNPGDWHFSDEDEEKRGDPAWQGVPPKWLRFGCPKGQGECIVALRPQKMNNGASWQWDGNRAAPTVTPSINCHGCGWHGFLTAGVFRGV